MSEEESFDNIIEFDKRLTNFQFKSTSLIYPEWKGTNAVINIYNRENRRKSKSKEERILNRLDMWITSSRPAMNKQETYKEPVKYSTVNLGKIKRPFIKRTGSLEESSNITCTTKFSGILDKHRNKIHDGLFKHKSSLNVDSGYRDRSLSKENIYGEVVLSDYSETDENDKKLYQSRTKKTSRRSSAQSTKSEDSNTRSNPSGKENDLRKESLKSNGSGHIRLFPSKCPVDDPYVQSDTMKSKESKILIDNSSNKYNPYPMFYKPENESEQDCVEGKRPEYNRNYSAEPRRKYHSRSSESLTTYKSGIAKFENELRNLYNTAPQDIRIHDTYDMNKMSYYKNNPQHQTIRRSVDICTMQDYVNSIKESRSSIKQCSQDIKNFLESPPNTFKKENTRISPKRASSDKSPNKQKSSMISISTPDVSKLMSKDEEKGKRLAFSKDDYRRSWSDVKSILHCESYEEHLV